MSAAAPLFETTSDVKRLGGNVDARVDTLDGDLVRLAVKRYGPDMFGATITAEQLDQFRADRAFHQSWTAFRSDWKAYWLIELEAGEAFLVMSADHFRRVSEFEAKLRGFEADAKKRGAETTYPDASKMKGNDGLPSAISDASKAIATHGADATTTLATLFGVAVGGLILVHALKK